MEKLGDGLAVGAASRRGAEDGGVVQHTQYTKKSMSIWKIRWGLKFLMTGLLELAQPARGFNPKGGNHEQ